MNDVSTIPTRKGLARRRLVRGIFATPVVLPLCSGAQVAVASNRRCIKNESELGETPGGIDSPVPGDTWVRVRLWTLSTKTTSGTSIDSTWVKGKDVENLLSTQPAGVRHYLQGSKWQCFTAADGSQYKVDDKLPTGKPNRDDYELKHNGAYVAIRVDANGNILGVVGVGSGGGAVHQSCWTSFKA